MAVHKFRLSAITQETPEVKTFRFEPLEPFTFEAGQFVLLRVGGEARAYSISSPAYERKFIDLTIRIGTESYFPKKLEALTVGDVVEIDGPHGRFTHDSSTQNAVFIGAGVGIAGLRSLWSELLRVKPGARITIIYSARTQSEIIWRAAFGSMKNAKTVISLTREQPACWVGELGRIDVAMIKRNVRNVGKNHYYVCGPPEMVSSVEVALTSLGVPTVQIKAEKWGGIEGTV